ncbi:streptophobe family protein [Phaeacidiphilus oryzae]|uniref:streptophobe family protein n=1 Tax=Phaeacidiphilus oryzae TaxID=348818 RepID=UPI000691A084|nr:streptophobe family protein [Phaeacidiphilus oryzae]
MTVYQHRGPSGAPGPPQGRAGFRPLLAVVQSASAAAWAFVVMAGIASLGLWLVGVGRYASLSAATAAVMAMAVGGTVSPTGDLKVFGLDAAGAAGAIDIVPLGVTVTGAVTLGWFFSRPLRRRLTVGAGELALRAGSAAVAFLMLAGIVGWAGDGQIAIKLNDVLGGSGGSGSGSGGSGGSGGGLLGGLGGLLGAARGRAPAGPGLRRRLGGLGGIIGQVTGAQPTVGFKVDVWATIGAALVFVLAVLALSLLVSRRAAVLPGTLGLLRTGVRPTASAVVSAVLWACCAGAAAGLIDGVAGKGGKAAVGGVLLGTPNGVFLAVPLGMGVPLHGQSSGALSALLPAQVRDLLKGGGGRDITVSALAGMDGRVWLLVVAVALLLVLIGMFAAVRTPVGAAARSRVAEAAVIGARVGVAMAVATPCMVALAAVSVNADVSVFGFNATGAALSISGNVGLALVLGLVEGAVAGFLGALLVLRFAEGKRPGTVSARAAEPPRGPGFETPPPPPAAERPAGSSYGALPLPPNLPPGPPEDNPYR